MAENDVTFVFHKEWLDNIKCADIDTQNKIIADLVRYGCGVECVQDEALIKAYINSIKGRIDYSKEKYQEKVGRGECKSGRKPKIDNNLVYKLANEGKNSTEISEILKCSKSTVDHCDGWRFRKDKDFEDG